MVLPIIRSSTKPEDERPVFHDAFSFLLTAQLASVIVHVILTEDPFATRGAAAEIEADGLSTVTVAFEKAEAPPAPVQVI